MANRRFEMYQYRQIIVRLRLGEASRAIARAEKVGRNKIRAICKIAKSQGWLDANKPLPDDNELRKYFHEPKYQSANTSKAKFFQSKIERWVEQGIQATTIHAALTREHGFTGSYFSILRLVKKIKESDISHITMPLDFKPGECAQVDFGAGPKFIDSITGEVKSSWIFVMVLAWSRHLYAEIVLDQTVYTWLGCHRRAFEFFGGVPSKVIIDNPKCAITKACYYDPQVQRAYADLAEGYEFIISPCPPREPKKKGRVESGVKYIKNNFVPLREFRDIVDGNQQLQIWIIETAGNRIHGSTHDKPLTRFEETERSLLKALPDKIPELVVWAKAKVHGDCHLQFEKCRYSAPYALVKRDLWVRAGETTIRIFRDHELVALHPRLFKPGSRSTLPEHVPPHGLAYVMHDPQWCLKQAELIGKHCHQLIQNLFASTVLDNLRSAQGIIGLQKKYGAKRLEAACQRALAFDSSHYRTVKTILAKGLEYQALPETKAFDELANTYTGQGQYCRDPSTLLQ